MLIKNWKKKHAETTRNLRGNYAETTRNLRGNQRLKRDFWRFLRRKKRGNPRKKRHFSIHGILS